MKKKSFCIHEKEQNFLIEFVLTVKLVYMFL